MSDIAVKSEPFVPLPRDEVHHAQRPLVAGAQLVEIINSDSSLQKSLESGRMSLPDIKRVTKHLQLTYSNQSKEVLIDSIGNCRCRKSYTSRFRVILVSLSRSTSCIRY